MQRAVDALNKLLYPPRLKLSPTPSGVTHRIGSDAEAMEHRTPLQEAGLRLPWLMVTMLIDLCAGFVVNHFSDILKQLILLASFMPVISAISGNVGLQAAAIIVRALDTRQIHPRDWWRSVLKELMAIRDCLPGHDRLRRLPLAGLTSSTLSQLTPCIGR
jgi:hypothetical protein